MLKNYKKNNELIFTVLVNMFFVLAYNLMFYPRFHSDLDILMQSSIYGVSGVVSSYILYSNILLGKLFTILVSIFPGVPWYIIFHYALIFVSLFMITYITVRRNKSVAAKILAMVTLAIVGYEAYVEPNHMKTSVVLCVCAAYLLLYAFETNSKNKVFGVVILAVLSSLISFSAFLISAIVGFGIVCVYCLIKKCAKEWKIIIAITIMSIIVLGVGARLFDTTMYKRNAKEMDLGYRNSIEKMFGYGTADYAEDMQEKYGVDELHYNSISEGVFFSQGNTSLELLKEISKENQSFSWDTFTKYFRTVPISLFQTGMMYYLIILCVVFWLSGCDKRIVVATIGILLVEYFMFYLFNAWKYEWICFIIMLPISLLLLIETKSVVVKDSQTLIAYTLVLGVILYLNFYPTMATSVHEEGTTELYAQVEQENIYIIDMIEYLRTGSVYKVYDRAEIPRNVFIMNGAYGLMDGYSHWLQLGAPGENEEYHRLYNPSKAPVMSLF